MIKRHSCTALPECLSVKHYGPSSLFLEKRGREKEATRLKITGGSICGHHRPVNFHFPDSVRVGTFVEQFTHRPADPGMRQQGVDLDHRNEYKPPEVHPWMGKVQERAVHHSLTMKTILLAVRPCNALIAVTVSLGRSMTGARNVSAQILSNWLKKMVIEIGEVGRNWPDIAKWYPTNSTTCDILTFLQLMELPRYRIPIRPETCCYKRPFHR